MTKLNPLDLIDSLNTFRNLMKICFKDHNNFNDTEILLSSIKISPKITTIIITQEVETTLLTKDIGNTFSVIENLKDFLDNIKLNAISNTLTSYINVDNFNISKIKNNIDSSTVIKTEYKDYLAYLIYYHYYLIILCGIGCITGIAPTNDTNALYNSYNINQIKYL
jgi:hypothetical protein